MPQVCLKLLFPYVEVEKEKKNNERQQSSLLSAVTKQRMKLMINTAGKIRNVDYLKSWDRILTRLPIKLSHSIILHSFVWGEMRRIY